MTEAPDLTVAAAALSDDELAAHLVAVLFAAAHPLTRAEAARVLDTTLERLERVCNVLAARPPLGLALQSAGDTLLLTTAPHTASAVERYFGAPPPVRLSKAALEALAVIAYRQPVTRGEIDAVRGVNSDSAVSTLLARGLAAEVGRKETAGRPALLATTPELLHYLGLTSLDELVPLPPALRDAVTASADAVGEAASPAADGDPEGARAGD